MENAGLRRATVSDASSLAALSIEVWISTYIRDGVNGFFADYALSEFTTAKFEDILSKDNEHIWVSQNVVGITGFSRLTAGNSSPVVGLSDAEIATLYVQPRHQGKHIGDALLRAGLRHCIDTGVNQPWLAVNSKNSGAIEFYQSRGFVVSGQTHFHIGDQKYLNEIMSIDLSSVN